MRCPCADWLPGRKPTNQGDLEVRICGFAKSHSVKSSDVLAACRHLGILGKGFALDTLNESDIARLETFFANRESSEAIDAQELRKPKLIALPGLAAEEAFPPTNCPIGLANVPPDDAFLKGVAGLMSRAIAMVRASDSLFNRHVLVQYVYGAAECLCADLQGPNDFGYETLYVERLAHLISDYFARGECMGQDLVAPHADAIHRLRMARNRIAHLRRENGLAVNDSSFRDALLVGEWLLCVFLALEVLPADSDGQPNDFGTPPAPLLAKAVERMNA
jgi:hypothetical protein